MYKHLFGQFCNFQISASKNSTDFNLGSLEREYSILLISYKIRLTVKVIRGHERSKMDAWMYKHLFGQFCNFQISASKNSADFNLGSLKREYSIWCNRL